MRQLLLQEKDIKNPDNRKVFKGEVRVETLAPNVIKLSIL